MAVKLPPERLPQAPRRPLDALLSRLETRMFGGRLAVRPKPDAPDGVLLDLDAALTEILGLAESERLRVQRFERIARRRREEVDEDPAFPINWKLARWIGARNRRK